MNDIQKHLVKLLREIDEICIKNEIPYLLYGRTAKDACTKQDFVGTYMSASIIMRGQDFDKFRAAVKSVPNRAVESIAEYDDYADGMSMRYVDETTTYLYGHTAHNYHLKGIFVTIENCRNIPEKSFNARIANGIEKLISYSVKKDCSSLSPKKQKVVKAVHAAQKVLGKRTVINMLLKNHRRLTSKSSSTLAHVRSLKDNINIPASMFDKIKSVKFGDCWFRVPEETDKYLQLVYKKTWKTDTKPENASSPHLLVTSTCVSYKDVFTDDSVYRSAQEVEEISTQRVILGDRIKEFRGKIEKNWDVLFLTQERYRLYKQFVPVLDIIQDYYKCGEYGWLSVVMKDYITTTAAYANKNWPVVVSDELDEIVFDMMYRSGKAKEALAFREMKKKIKLKPINVKFSEEDYAKARAMLVPTIESDENNNIPVYVHYGNDYYPVMRMNSDGVISALFTKDNSSVKVASEIAEEKIVIKCGDIITDLFGDSEWHGKLFAESVVVDLVQQCFGNDVVIARMDINGFVYVTSEFVSENIYGVVEAPFRCIIKENGEIPVYIIDSDDELIEIFRVNKNGERVPFVVAGIGGNIIVNGRESTLYYTDKEGNRVEWSLSQYYDDSHDSILCIVSEEQEPIIMKKLVQKDTLGRIVDIAAVIDDGSVVPMVRIDTDKSLIPVPVKRKPVSTLCVKQNDGSVIPVATIDIEGKITAIEPAADLVSVM